MHGAKMRPFWYILLLIILLRYHIMLFALTELSIKMNQEGPLFTSCIASILKYIFKRKEDKNKGTI